MNALNRNAFSDRTLRAFSLTELLVVLVIIGILVLVAMPNLMPLISRAKATGYNSNLHSCIRWKRAISTPIHDIPMIWRNLGLNKRPL